MLNDSFIENVLKMVIRGLEWEKGLFKVWCNFRNIMKFLVGFNNMYFCLLFKKIENEKVKNKCQLFVLKYVLYKLYIEVFGYVLWYIDNFQF